MKSKINKAKFQRLSRLASAGLVLGCRLMVTPSHAEDLGEPPSAAVAKVTREDLFKELTVDAEFRPYVEAQLHAKVSGYVKSINVDFGDTVKAGQLLAVLEVPELQDELMAAEASKEKAQADYNNTHLMYTRLVSVNQTHPNLVAQQDLDTAQAQDDTSAATIAAAKADVEKYQTLINYTQITAPFDGVVTRRYADPGQLIQEGMASDSQAKPLVRISDNYRLRLDFPVTVDYAKDIETGAQVTVEVESLDDQTFTGTICRFTHDVDESTRTMMTEIEVPNADLRLMPGMYAKVVLKVERRPHALAIPIEAVPGVGPPSVLVINSAHEIEERPVMLGLETPDRYEVISGLQEGDLVVVGSRAQFQAGEKVSPKLAEISSTHEN